MTTTSQATPTAEQTPDSPLSGRHTADPGAPIDFGYAGRTVRIGPLALRLRTRAIVVNATLAVVALSLGIVAIGMGEFPLSPREVLETFLGGGEKFHRTIVLEWRTPVVVAAIVFGALLGVGGAIFQSLTRNPLGSPDIIGFDAGSYTAVIITMLIIGTRNYYTIATASLVGGLITAFVVYILAWRRGIQGFRLIIVGIGVTAILGSVNAYLITRADIQDAMAVGFWGAGSLGRVTWDSMGPSLIITAGLMLAAALLAPALRQLELGDDAAMSQGVSANRARLALIVIGVGTTALVTAAAGPIGFVALVAPQLARRLTRSPGVSIAGAAFMGAAILIAAQFLNLLVASFYRPVPVGLITVALGGIYLIWLLIKETRRTA